MIHKINLESQECQMPPHKTKANLNVFALGWIKPWNWASFWRNLGHNIANVPYVFKWAWQRAIRGYCDFDISELGLAYLDYLIATLTEYRNKTDSWSPALYTNFEDFIADIDMWIDNLEFCRQDPDDIVLCNWDGDLDDAEARDEYYADIADCQNRQEELLIETLHDIAVCIPSLWI